MAKPKFSLINVISKKLLVGGEKNTAKILLKISCINKWIEFTFYYQFDLGKKSNFVC